MAYGLDRLTICPPGVTDSERNTRLKSQHYFLVHRVPSQSPLPFLRLFVGRPPTYLPLVATSIYYMLIYSRLLPVDHLLRRKYLQPTPNYHAYQIFHSEHILRMHHRRHPCTFSQQPLYPSQVVVFNCIRHAQRPSPFQTEAILQVSVLGPLLFSFSSRALIPNCISSIFER